jgi:U4/U6 small nuclear ribonucleoprotein PRP3
MISTKRYCEGYQITDFKFRAVVHRSKHSTDSSFVQTTKHSLHSTHSLLYLILFIHKSVMPASESTEQRKRKRWGDAVPSANKEGNGSATADDAKSKAAALQQSISARLAALKAKKAQQTTHATETLSSASDRVSESISTDEPVTKKAKVYDLDMSMVAPTFKQNDAPAKKVNPYLAHTYEDNLGENVPSEKNSGGVGNTEDEVFLLDSRLAGGHVVKPRERRELKFVEPGSYIHKAERRRAKVENAKKSGFVSGRKVGTFVKSVGIADAVSEEHNASGDYYGGSSSTADALLLQDQNIEYLVKHVPRADAIEEGLDGSTKSTGGMQVIPTPLVLEWWDVEMLPVKLRKEVVAVEGKAVTMRANQRMKIRKKQSTPNDLDKDDMQEDSKSDEENAMIQIKNLTKQCVEASNISCCKTYKLIQHPVPVKPPNAPKEAPVPTLYLTKKEMKRQRKLRRAEKQRDLQDMQAAGLIPAPEPRLTLSNFMRVLGEQAVLDPSKMEAKVMEQIQARKLKHEKMNAERKLTKEQRASKIDKKLTEDTSQAVNVALFLVKDMSHRYHRTKIDLNAQQHKITGGVLECARPQLSLIICEGGPKSIKRFTRLMLVRMKWKGENFVNIGDSDEELDEEGNATEKSQKFNPDNSCDLIWTGMSPKRVFNSFVFQACESADIARKVLEAKGVAHFWDQAITHHSGGGDTFNFTLSQNANDDNAKMEE